MSWLALAAGAALSIQPIGDDPTRVVVETRSAPEGSKLTFYRSKGEGEPIFGKLETAGKRLIFRPSFALSRGEQYIAKLEFPNRLHITEEYFVPEEKGTVPKVVKILPGGERVPANCLKFYVQFDQAMREGREIFDQIELIGEDGKAVNSPWRRQEVWSDDAKRLILFIHPGRIKQGLQLRAEMGPVLEEGKSYSLVISEKVRAANGISLGEEFSMPFKTGASLRERIDPAEWTLIPPAVESDEPFVFRTNRALDPYLVQRHCEIRGKKLDRVTWNEAQTEFRFFPAGPWAAGDYELIVGEYLEDLAGNTPMRVFDTDLESADAETEPRLHLKFAIGQ